MGYTKEYWQRVGGMQAEKRRHRYANDPEYRKNALDRAAEYREKKRQEKEAFLSNPYIMISGEKVPALTADGVCEALGIDIPRLKYLQKSRYIPPALVLRPTRLYTYSQLDLISQVEAFLSQNSEYLRTPNNERGEKAVAQREELKTTIAANWEK